MKLIVTCEHGGNNIPEKYQSYFKDEEAVLNSHLGYDLGALDAFEHLKQLSEYSKQSETSRLLIELNRSLNHPKLFSSITKHLHKEEKVKIITEYYLPYRNAVESKIKSYILNNQYVIHISIHSFTPILNHMERHCDVGLLYDSTKKEEKQFCKQLKRSLKKIDPSLNVRYNYPYLGKADGFTTYLRKRFPVNYIGIELEINQKFSKNNIMDNHLKDVVFKALKEHVSV